MYFTNNSKVIEGEAIASMHRFDLVTINGEQYVEATFKLDPAVRAYAEGEAPFYFAVSDGINVRLLSNVGLPAVVAHEAPVEAPAVPEASEAPAAPEATEAPAAVEAPVVVVEASAISAETPEAPETSEAAPEAPEAAAEASAPEAK